MNKVEKHITHALSLLEVTPHIRRVTTYVSPKVTIKVTKQRRVRSNAKQQTYLLSVGSPNFLERRALKAGKIAKFPLKKYEMFAT